MIALLSSLGSRHRRMEASFYSTMSMELTHAVGSSRFVMMPFCSIASSFSFTFGSNANGTLLQACTVGHASLLIVMWCFPGNLPGRLSSKTSLYSVRRACDDVALTEKAL